MIKDKRGSTEIIESDARVPDQRQPLLMSRPAFELLLMFVPSVPPASGHPPADDVNNDIDPISQLKCRPEGCEVSWPEREAARIAAGRAFLLAGVRSPFGGLPPSGGDEGQVVLQSSLPVTTPEQCPSVVSLLAESYNPHVRYGAAMALGIACAGTGLKEAIGLLDPMTNDPVNFVRQGALIASAMILIQHTEQTCPKVKDFRSLYAKVIVDKHEDVMAKFGAILAQGIIDAGGRNVSLSLESRTGHTNMLAVVGMLVFTQYWYWFPLAPFYGLIIIIMMPKLEIRSNAKPSMFAYPPPLEEKKREEREKVTTAVLSIAARARRRITARLESSKMEVDEEAKKEEEKEKEKKEKEEKEKKEEKKPEPNFEILSNPARVMKNQLKVCTLVDSGSYVPLKDISIGGIIMVRHVKAGSEEEQLVEPVAAFGPKPDDEKEPEPPEPFEYTEE
ncbi:unnamed protein product [Nezara viridula]|uniref:26S proteasome regulatory subunit RPN2 C-terminal domain-containing protein n=1 Tax=Nezara viridula TaxID=85310 RepID=A0A9P0MQE1_NEZVI|nr:unnamed protein product [Nezara viridula]